MATWEEIPTIPEIEPLPPLGDEAWVALHREAKLARDAHEGAPPPKRWRVEGSNGHQTFRDIKRAAEALIEGQGELLDMTGKVIARVCVSWR